MSNKSGVSSQVISLPKGGGALSGVGETFSPDLFTGTGNLTIPLATPPGRNGFQPELNLIYSSGNGSGPFGLGWNVSVAGISRKTSKGIPIYDDTADTFILSGAEDLVPVEVSETETRYCPRTETLFARIIHHYDATNDYWEIRSKDGLVSLYGTPDAAGDDPAAVADPDDRSNVFAWKLTQTEDPFGNIIQYEYARDSSEAGERHWDQIYLRRVRYIDYTSGTEERFLATIVFEYGDRPDPYSDYRAGFEIRTRQRCEKIETWTHADQDRLVRSYDLLYLDERTDSEQSPPINGVSLLHQIIVTGHDENITEALPPVEFGYSRFQPQGRKFFPVEGELPAVSLASPDLETVDLFGNGLPDILQMNGVVRYWRNLGNGCYDRPRMMQDAPAGLTLADPGVQLLDANGDGRIDLLVTVNGQAGYYPLTFQGTWDRKGFQRYAQAPSFNLEAPDVRLVDLNGDGVTDVVRSGTRFEYFFNDPETGWNDTRQAVRGDLDQFPDLNFSDARVRLGDMNGDGLQDIVSIHDGTVEYWPNRGYGRWSARVVMQNSPRFSVQGFDPSRVLLGDVDGDGLADLIYVDNGQVQLWINQSGNGWSEPITIRGTPQVTDIDAVRLIDLQGTGVSGLLWSRDANGYGKRQMFFLDFTGGVKPYLLDTMDNHMGAITRVEYQPSTVFYVQDAQRWRTPLPFPVQVVARVEVIDHFSRSRLITEYRYHDGYWDGEEREFRGFGLVEQFDTEIFHDVEQAHRSPPTLTKTWFHQGPIFDDEAQVWTEADYRDAYWSADLQLLQRPADQDAFLAALEPQDRRDAIRTLRGRVMRSELYALDRFLNQDHTGPEDRPYTVTEYAYGIEEKEADASVATKRIFFPHVLAQRTTQWERGEDPLTQIIFTGEYDPFGQPQEQTMIALPRRQLKQQTRPEAMTRAVLATHTVTQYAAPSPNRYICDRVSQSWTFELTEPPLVVERDRENLIQVLTDQLEAARFTHGKFREFREGWSPGQQSDDMRVIEHTLHYYDGEAFVGLPLGRVGSFGALVRTESLALDEPILQAAYGGERPPYFSPGDTADWTGYPEPFRDHLRQLRGMAGYNLYGDDGVHQPGFYVLGMRQRYDFQDGAQGTARGLLRATRDPLGGDGSAGSVRDTVIEYDAFDLLPAKVTTPAGLEIQAEYDYRVLQPREITDPNGNRSLFTFSPLGLLRETWVQGKGENEGDRERPSTRMEYDFMAFVREGGPISVRTIRHEHHDTETDVDLPERDATIETREYSDGFGRLVQTRIQAEDLRFGDCNVVLPLDQGEDTGTRQSITAVQNDDPGAPNVVVSGWQSYNNKGWVVEKYESFCDQGWEYDPSSRAQRGHKVTMHYDPRGQVIRTVNPDGSERRIIYGVPGSITEPDVTRHDENGAIVFEPTPWEAFTYDANDLAPLSTKTLPDGSIVSLADRAAADHHFTPGSILIDGLGHTVESVECNGPSPADWYTTRSTYDLRGNLLTVIDPLGREAFRYVYDLANRPLHTVSIDAGTRSRMFDAGGNQIERRDSKGALILQAYDILSRPVCRWARDGSEGDITLRERLEYGDGGTAEQSAEERLVNREHNRLGQLRAHYDEAGLLILEQYDFKGNVLEKIRQVIRDEPLLSVFPQEPLGRWIIQPFQVNWQPEGVDFAAHAAALLDPQPYQTSTRYDALNRIKTLQYPEDVAGERRVLHPEYNRAGALERVRLDSGEITVEHIAYNARGQRTLIAYGNGIMTRYAYHPETFRLARLRSERYSQPDAATYQPGGGVLQDFAYEYDLAGNIQQIRDRAPGCGLPTQPDQLDRAFGYDAIYRLTSATGREHAKDPAAFPWDERPRSQDITRTQAYSETYVYDPAGNMSQLRHTATAGQFTRNFILMPGTNRLHEVSTGSSNPFRYDYDDGGNLIGEGTARHFEWDHSDRMKVFRTQPGDSEPSIYAHYLYDASGQRVKKLVRRQGGGVETTVYIDEIFEHQRWGSAPDQHNNHLHVMDDQRRVALVRIGDAHPDDAGPAQQYHLGDHLDSSHIVVSADGSFINREEHTPYGESSFGSFGRKRYRFTGKERDEESGLNYHGVRYYAPWLARWCSTDPAGIVDGLNQYSYVTNQPLAQIDPTGTQGNEPQPPPVNADEESAPPQTAGAGSATLWDAEHRQRYKKENKAASKAAREKIEGAKASGDLKKAGEAAEEGSRGRNWRRETTRKRLTPGGRLVSEALDQPRAWDDIIKKYGNPYESFEAAEEIADATGRTRASLRWLGTLGRWAGGIGIAAGFLFGGHAVANAPPGKRAGVLVEEVSAAAGGGGGAVLGGWLGAGAVAFLASNPGGWVIAGALVGGGLVGYAGERLGRWVGKKAVNRVEEAVEGANTLIELQVDRYWERQRAKHPGCPPSVCGAPRPDEDDFYREGEHLNRDMRMRRSPW